MNNGGCCRSYSYLRQSRISIQSPAPLRFLIVYLKSLLIVSNKYLFERTLKTRDNKMWSFFLDQIHAGWTCDDSLGYSWSSPGHLHSTGSPMSPYYPTKYMNQFLSQISIRKSIRAKQRSDLLFILLFSSLLILDPTLMTHQQTCSNTMVKLWTCILRGGDWIRLG